ncbi:hypothetical protein [Streptomyces arboris]|uniref:Lipoprotein n=1 Tax=Streptomyces arboris TaxID=2600619 RepID=A0A5N5EJV2_9ACTN|nr:hypothetical protein [Streptomyces arboris]KAB2590543.1 hypothetical protein F5983_21155 [Streptomyces arboris]
MRLTTHGWRAAPAGVLLAAALLTGCTDSGRDSDKPGPGPTASGPSQEERDEKLGREAEAAVGMTGDEPEFTESGVSRVGEGIHSQSLLTPGKSYEVSFACAGSGAAEATVQSKGTTEVKTVECGGAPVHVRVHDAPRRVTIDVTAVGKASGMAAYRIADFTP